MLMQMTKSCSREKNGAGREDLGPPGADQRRTGERVADEDRVVTGSIEPAVDRIVKGDAGERASALEQQGSSSTKSPS